jgi:hypothetical protein
MTQVLPRFLGLGALKAGTSLLHELLAEHPGVAVPAHRKEVMFFDQHWARGPAWYAEHFAHAGDRLPGEISPGYLWHPDAPARAASLVPDAKLLVMVREPVRRAYSQFTFFVKEHGYNRDFATFLHEHPNAIERGMYAAQIGRWLEHFPRERLHVEVFEDLTADPVGRMRAVYGFLGVDDGYVPRKAGEKVNESRIPRLAPLYRVGRQAVGWLYRHDGARLVHALKQSGLKRLFFPDKAEKDAFPPLDADSRARLTAAYADDSAALARLLGRPTGWARPS